MIKSWKMRSKRPVAYVEDRRKAYSILIGKPKSFTVETNSNETSDFTKCVTFLKLSNN
jgi:hypothetical protein